jgi:DNA invertase Pin-like site-specific DNA recombinase
MTDSLKQAGRNIQLARQRLERAMSTAEQVTLEAHENGIPETEIARTLGVNRLTVRRWLGKN